MTFERTRDPLVGKVLGDCVLEERIGRGGMGTVYRARRKADRRLVAIKVLSPFMAAEDAVVARFTREARAASRIRHPNVVRVLGTAMEDGVHFTVMDYVDGENLAEVLKREGRLPAGRAVFIAGEVAKGLAALHAEGIIHRDVKPSNILVGTDGSVRVTDFGIARDVFELQRLTAPGDLLGTLGFAAPEQLQRSEGDARADLYSLGATLHFMLSGVRPPANPTTPRPSLDDRVPPEVRDLVGRLLAAEPAGRPAEASLVASALAPYAVKPVGRSLKERCLRGALKFGGGALAFGAGVLATSSRGPDFHADPGSLVFPAREALLSVASLFSSGMLLAFFAFIRGRERIGLGLRSILGCSFLAGALVLAYMAGSAVETLTLGDAALSLVSFTPEILFAEALALAAVGLSLGMRKPGAPLAGAIGGTLVLLALGAAATASSDGSVVQALGDLRDALGRGGWAWGSFALAGVGLAAAYRHRGRLWQILLAPLAVFASLGLVYWASQRQGSPPLLDTLAAPGGEIALAVLLALGARAILDLRTGPRGPSASAREFDTTGSSATPPPAV